MAWRQAMGADLRSAMTARLVDQLYVEAMVLADEARAYFDGRVDPEREAMAAERRVSFACESLRVTTRLMHVVAWLLQHKAEAVGEAVDASDRQLGRAAASDPAVVALLPAGARDLVVSSSDLYDRVDRLDRELALAVPESPARDLQDRLKGMRF